MCGTPKTNVTIPWRTVMSMKTVSTYQNRSRRRGVRPGDIDGAHNNFDVEQRFKVSRLQKLSLETLYQLRRFQ